MSSILDHVEQAVPRATVYGAMKGSPVFIGKYFREVNPASNATTYRWHTGERKITFVLASPDKTIFNDMRSVYLRYNLDSVASVIGTEANDHADNDKNKISEPGSNWIERIVIKMNGTVVEDISKFDYLTSFFKRKLLTRDEKNARSREGYDFVPTSAGRTDLVNAADQLTVANDFTGGDDAVTAKNSELVAAINATAASVIAKVNEARPADKSGQQIYGVNAADLFAADHTNISGTKDLCIKLDLSGIMNSQQLLSGYYSPLEIDLYLQDPSTCGQSNASVVNAHCIDYRINAPRLCIEQIVMSPEYVSAFEAALLANSSAQGIQIPFTTYYPYQQNIKDSATFWIRKPVRYLKAVYWGAVQSDKQNNGESDSYRFCRVTSHLDGVRRGKNIVSTDASDAGLISSYQISIGTKTYRRIDDNKAGNDPTLVTFNESDVMFAKSVGHYNDYSTEDGSLTSLQKGANNQTQGIDLEFSPDNDVLASETTLNSNDVRISLKMNTIAEGDASFHVYTFLQYQASIALFPGNETRLLVT